MARGLRKKGPKGTASKFPKLPRGIRLRIRSHGGGKLAAVPVEPGTKIVIDVSIEVNDDLPDDQMQDVEDQISILLDRYGQAIVTLAGVLVPVKTGFLRDSLYYVADEEQLVLTVGADADYAPVVEKRTPFSNRLSTAWDHNYRQTLTTSYRIQYRKQRQMMKEETVKNLTLKDSTWNYREIWN